MKTLALSMCLFVAACTDEPPDYPLQPGGGSVVTGGGGGGGESLLRGRVCMSEDLIDRASCMPSGVGGLTVSLGDSTATTYDDGTFEMPRPEGALLQYMVSGEGAITTTTPYSPSLTIPVVNADVWATMLASNNLSIPEGTGSILGSLARGGQPVSGMQVTSTPTGAAGPLYDTDTGFGFDRTGRRGVFLIPGVTAGTSSLAFSPGETQVAGISVINGGVTILDSVALP